MNDQTIHDVRRFLMSRICARWHDAKNYSLTTYLDKEKHPGQPLQCTADLYQWMEKLTTLDLIEVLESQGRFTFLSTLSNHKLINRKLSLY